jgi:hypothetical protein
MASWFRKGPHEDLPLKYWVATMAGRALRRQWRYLRFFCGPDANAVQPGQPLSPEDVMTMEMDHPGTDWNEQILPTTFRRFDDYAKKHIARVVPEAIRERVTLLLERAATVHAARIALAPAHPPLKRQRLLKQATDAANALHEAMGELQGDYSLDECLDVQHALRDLEQLAAVMKRVAEWETAQSKPGRPPEAARNDLAVWVAEILARSGIEPTSTLNGAFATCLWITLSLSGDPGGGDTKPLLLKAGLQERERQLQDGLLMYPFARAVFGESDHERQRREEHEEAFRRELDLINQDLAADEPATPNAPPSQGKTTPTS